MMAQLFTAVSEKIDSAQLLYFLCKTTLRFNCGTTVNADKSGLIDNALVING